MANRNAPNSRLVVAGHPFAPIGMGEVARSLFRAFRAAHADPRLRDIYRVHERDDPDYGAEFASFATDRLSESVNVFAINGDEVEQATAHLNDPNFGSAFNVIAPAWELSRYPAEWAKQLDKFDEIWAMSDFVRASIGAATSTPVIRMPLVVEPALSAIMNRRALALPEHAFIFLFFFDYSSYLARKNPFAVLEAFNRLVERNPKAPFHLVLKHKGGQSSPADEKRFKATVGKHSDQIQIIDRRLSNAETRNLIRNSDCFVSLHRSEGFGYGLAEAMALGTPAVATGYSGNLDFMNDANSWLVDYDLVPVQPGEYPHAEQQVWADPRIPHAVEAMEAVWNNRPLARQKARRAALDIARDYSSAAVGFGYVKRLESILSN
ncbi:MAG TPA: glycosyltransferase family 4 protein [Caulobacteraceae bacterium]|nr:glycosyltransferase family 4 protein [Caulobacteraceae bacterium]